MSGIAFQNVGGLIPGRTRFDWHTSTKLDCEMGQLIPIFVKRVLPGDYWKIEHDILVRCTPLVAPVMHEITIDTHYFFIPERIIDDCNSRPGAGNPKGDPILLNGNPPPANRFNWELFITGGFDGNDQQIYPKWEPSNTAGLAPYKFSLWDYCQLPTLPNNSNWTSPLLPMDAPRRCYNFIYNEYYRDETLQDPIPWTNEKILNRAWRKDYFTSALPFQQRGIAPAFPVTGGVSFPDNLIAGASNQIIPIGVATSGLQDLSYPLGGTAQITTINGSSTPSFGTISNQTINTQQINANLKNALDRNTLENAVTFDVADLRNIVQLQKYLERNARAGVRFNEFLKAHFNTNLRDERIQRPEYIGGTKQPLIISEVLQTSESGTTPQGNMSGHGISATGNEVGSFNAVEHGWIMGIMSIMPVPSYQQGINRTFLSDTKLDFFTPEFVNLSEQGIKKGELFISGLSTDEALHGYIGMYDEYRTQNSTVCGNFRDSLNYWHLGRIFQNQPSLNKDFIEIKPEDTRRIFVDQTEPGLLCDIEHYFHAVRPLPEIAEPGLTDHH